MPSQNPPQESLTSALGKIVNPQAFTSAEAPNPTPAVRAATFKPKVSTKAATKPPLSKDKGKTLEEQGQAVGEEVDKDLKKQSAFDSAVQAAKDSLTTNPGDLLKQNINVYGANVPKPEDVIAAAAQGSSIADFGSGDRDIKKQGADFNQMVLKKAMGDYLKKKENPYLGVDLENIDRMTASTFGGKLQGMKNVTEPTNEFNQMVGAGHYIQAQDALKAKETMDYAKAMLSPKLQYTYGAQTPPPIKPNAGSGIARERLNATLEDKMRNETAKITSSYNNEKSMLTKMKQGFAANDLQTTGILMSQFARTVGAEKGVLTDKDITRIEPSSVFKTFGQLEAYFSKTPTAQLDPKYVSMLNKMIDLSKERLDAKTKDELALRKKSWTAPGSAYKNQFAPGGAGEAIFNEFDQQNTATKKILSPSEWLKTQGK